jgi:hypothetical protein
MGPEIVDWIKLPQDGVKGFGEGRDVNSDSMSMKSFGHLIMRC